MERAARSRESSRGAPARHDYSGSTTQTRTTGQHKDSANIPTAVQTQTNSRSIPHTPSVCSQAMPEVTRDTDMRKSKRGRQLVPVENTAHGRAHLEELHVMQI